MISILLNLGYFKIGTLRGGNITEMGIVVAKEVFEASGRGKMEICLRKCPKNHFDLKL